MSAKFISLILGASMAITSITAAPARAADKDLARALTIIAGVAIVGAAINESSSRSRGHVSSRGHGNNGYYGHQPRRVQKSTHGQKRRAIQSRAYQRGYNDHRAQVQQRRVQKHRARRGYGS
ncbi:hypothetical protein O4H61_08920 [Roseovarius aestuarii]|nr:hypothetical protein [Roseovarius aestuarii]